MFQGKIRDVDLGADSSASAESETDDVSIDNNYLGKYLHENVQFCAISSVFDLYHMSGQ